MRPVEPYDSGEDHMSVEAKQIEVCKAHIIHDDVVDRVGKEMPGEEVFVALAEFFKVFGDSTRLRILYALLSSEMCVCDLAALLDMNQSAVSHQLRVLKQANLVTFRKEGKVVYYSPADDHIEQVFDAGFNHISEKAPR